MRPFPSLTPFYLQHACFIFLPQYYHPSPQSPVSFHLRDITEKLLLLFLCSVMSNPQLKPSCLENDRNFSAGVTASMFSTFWSIWHPRVEEGSHCYSLG